MLVRFDLCAVCGKMVFQEAWRAALAAVALATRNGAPAAWYWSPKCRSYHTTSSGKGPGKVGPL